MSAAGRPRGEGHKGEECFGTGRLVAALLGARRLIPCVLPHVLRAANGTVLALFEQLVVGLVYQLAVRLPTVGANPPVEALLVRLLATTHLHARSRFAQPCVRPLHIPRQRLEAVVVAAVIAPIFVKVPAARLGRLPRRNTLGRLERAVLAVRGVHRGDRAVGHVQHGVQTRRPQSASANGPLSLMKSVEIPADAHRGAVLARLGVRPLYSLSFVGTLTLEKVLHAFARGGRLVELVAPILPCDCARQLEHVQTIANVQGLGLVLPRLARAEPSHADELEPRRAGVHSGDEVARIEEALQVAERQVAVRLDGIRWNFIR
mmetsp:Transcript_32280/g.74606  ORF Transcript_32280/g.74606 Transcript_32280/m.74606 type:complete len:319 (-) Transcript_32280:298-1254(-)